MARSGTGSPSASACSSAAGRRSCCGAATPSRRWPSASRPAATATCRRSCSVGEMAAVLAGARQVVGLDTGFTHLAAAFGRPTLGIYCDHEPGLAGITGPGPVASIGGKGQVPSRNDGAGAAGAQLQPVESRRSLARGPTELFDALRRVAVPAQAAGALPEVVLGLEAASRAAVALQRLGAARTASRSAAQASSFSAPEAAAAALHRRQRRLLRSCASRRGSWARIGGFEIAAPAAARSPGRR